MISRISFFMFLFLSIYSCEKNSTEPSKEFDIQNLFQSWTHSYEEKRQTDAIQIYRPSTFKDFPPSRFRMKYVFHENGTCEWLYLHPADAHYMKTGKWEIDPEDNNVILIYDTANKLLESVSFRIIELEKDILQIIHGDL